MLALVLLGNENLVANLAVGRSEDTERQALVTVERNALASVETLALVVTTLAEVLVLAGLAVLEGEMQVSGCS